MRVGGKNPIRITRKRGKKSGSEKKVEKKKKEKEERGNKS